MSNFLPTVILYHLEQSQYLTGWNLNYFLLRLPLRSDPLIATFCGDSFPGSRHHWATKGRIFEKFHMAPIHIYHSQEAREHKDHMRLNHQ